MPENLLFGPSRRMQEHGRDAGVKSWAAVPALGQSLYEACPSRIFIQMGKFSPENRLQCIWSIESRQPIMHFTGSWKKLPSSSVRRVLENPPVAVVAKCLVHLQDGVGHLCLLKEGCSSLPLLQFSLCPNTVLLCTAASTVQMLNVNSSAFSAVELGRQTGRRGGAQPWGTCA